MSFSGCNSTTVNRVLELDKMWIYSCVGITNDFFSIQPLYMVNICRGLRDAGSEARLAWFLDHKRQIKKKNKLLAVHIQLMETIPKFDW